MTAAATREAVALLSPPTRTQQAGLLLVLTVLILWVLARTMELL